MTIERRCYRCCKCGSTSEVMTHPTEGVPLCVEHWVKLPVVHVVPEKPGPDTRRSPAYPPRPGTLQELREMARDASNGGKPQTIQEWTKALRAGKAPEVDRMLPLDQQDDAAWAAYVNFNITRDEYTHIKLKVAALRADPRVL